MVNEKLKLIRQTLNMSQSQFAEELGLQQGSYSGIESWKKGSITKQTEIILNLKFNVNIDFLYNRSAEIFINNTPENSNGEISIDKKIIEQFSKLTDTIYSQQKMIESLQEQNKKVNAQIEDATCANASGFE